MKTAIIILMALIAFAMLSLFFRDIEDGINEPSTTSELVAGLLATIVLAFILSL